MKGVLFLPKPFQWMFLVLIIFIDILITINAIIAPKKTTFRTYPPTNIPFFILLLNFIFNIYNLYYFLFPLIFLLLVYDKS